MARSVYNTSRHQHERARLRPIVEAGDAQCTEIICLMPTRWINPDEPWDLAHAETPDQYRGPAHPACNRAEGGKRGHIASCRAPHHHHGTNASRDW